MVSLSVIVATYNEIDNIAALVWMIRKEIQTLDIDFEIIIVDDASPDGTGEVVDKLVNTFSEVLAVHRTGKLGLGSAYRDALKVATGEWVVIMDADFSHAPADIPRLIQRQQESGADIVIATRYTDAPGSGVVGWPLLRYFTSCGANNMFVLAGLRGVSDVTGSFRLYRAEVLRTALEATQSRGYSFQPEVLTQAIVRGATVAEVPITFVDRFNGTTKFSPGEIFASVGTAIRLWWSRPWPVRKAATEMDKKTQ